MSSRTTGPGRCSSNCQRSPQNREAPSHQTCIMDLRRVPSSPPGSLALWLAGQGNPLGLSDPKSTVELRHRRRNRPPDLLAVNHHPSTGLAMTWRLPPSSTERMHDGPLLYTEEAPRFRNDVGAAVVATANRSTKGRLEAVTAVASTSPRRQGFQILRLPQPKAVPEDDLEPIYSRASPPPTPGRCIAGGGHPENQTD